MAIKAEGEITFTDISDGTDGSDGTNGKMFYGACNTASSTSAKVPASTIDGFTLYVGVTVAIKFTYANTATNPTLNINGTGAHSLRLNGSGYSYWPAGASVLFVYDGSYWEVCNTPLYGSSSTIGNPAGGNVYTDDSGIQIRHGSTILASIAAALIELGKNSISAVIKFCNDNVRIGSTTAGQGYIAGTKGVFLQSIYDIDNGSDNGIGISRNTSTGKETAMLQADEVDINGTDVMLLQQEVSVSTVSSGFNQRTLKFFSSHGIGLLFLQIDFETTGEDTTVPANSTFATGLPYWLYSGISSNTKFCDVFRITSGGVMSDFPLFITPAGHLQGPTWSFNAAYIKCQALIPLRAVSATA